MTVELLILAIAILVALVVVVWRYLNYRDMRAWHRSEYAILRTQLREQQEREIEAPSLIRQTLVVNTRDGRTIRGVMMSEHDDRITLVEAFYLAGNGEHQLAGQTHVPKENISFLQEVVLTQQTVDYEEADR